MFFTLLTASYSQQLEHHMSRHFSVQTPTVTQHKFFSEQHNNNQRETAANTAELRNDNIYCNKLNHIKITTLMTE